MVLNAPDVEDRLHAMEHKVIGSTVEEREAKFKPELATYARVVREARIPLQN